MYKGGVAFSGLIFILDYEIHQLVQKLLVVRSGQIVITSIVSRL